MYVAMLRGINVGGRNRLPMKDLAAIFRDAGCSRVRTYIQSGNVVFDAPQRTARRIPETVPAAIAARYGYRTPLILRTAAELAGAVEANPFPRKAADPKALHAVFLAAAPQPARAAALDPDRSPPDEFFVSGREIYLHCPNGLARTKLTNAWFDAQLKTVSTIRGWNTVLQLLKLAEQDCR